jgi:ABC-type spermidine/putrescine transport system permease subunit II
VREGVDPAIAAIGILLTAMTAVLLGGLALLRRRVA